jgi:photosystem II stability/assembly factor-like uncharacterized protein
MGWYTIEAPDQQVQELPAPLPYPFVPTDNHAQVLAVDPADDKRIFAGDFTSLMRSKDGGCTWEKVFSLLDVRPTAPSLGCDGELEGGVRDPSDYSANPCSRITSVDVAKVPSKPSRVYLKVSKQGYRTNAYAGEYLFLSEDGGDTWEQLRNPADPVGLIVQEEPLFGHLRVAPSEPDTVYLIRAGNLFVSHDAGRAWEMVLSQVSGQLSGSMIQAGETFAVSPSDPNLLWANFVTGAPGAGLIGAYTLVLHKSEDGGESWTPVASPAPSGYEFQALDVFHTTGSPPRLVGSMGVRGSTADELVYASNDDGSTWFQVPIPAGNGEIWSVLFGLTDRYAFATREFSGTVYRLDVKKGIGTVLKPIAFEESHMVTSQRYVPNAFHMLDDCEVVSNFFRCDLISIWRGKGA